MEWSRRKLEVLRRNLRGVLSLRLRMRWRWRDEEKILSGLRSLRLDAEGSVDSSLFAVISTTWSSDIPFMNVLCWLIPRTCWWGIDWRGSSVCEISPSSIFRAFTKKDVSSSVYKEGREFERRVNDAGNDDSNQIPSQSFVFNKIWFKHSSGEKWSSAEIQYP